jgi:hypothetical protein
MNGPMASPVPWLAAALAVIACAFATSFSRVARPFSLAASSLRCRSHAASAALELGGGIASGLPMRQATCRVLEIIAPEVYPPGSAQQKWGD